MAGVLRSTGSHARFVAKAAEAMEDDRITPGEAKELLAKILKHQQDMAEIAKLLALKAGA